MNRSRGLQCRGMGCIEAEKWTDLKRNELKPRNELVCRSEAENRSGMSCTEN